jgi:anti-anti-sigma factor
MDLEYTDIGETRRITLVGRLDTAGVSRVETRFTAVTAPVGKNTIVDMGEVTFLASLGVRMMISTGRVLARKGAKLVLLSVTPPVLEIIQTMGLSDIIPVAATEADALALVAG